MSESSVFGETDMNKSVGKYFIFSLCVAVSNVEVFTVLCAGNLSLLWVSHPARCDRILKNKNVCCDEWPC